MAKKGTSYYYFRIRRLDVVTVIPYGIKVSSIYIDDKIMLNFKQMTEEQEEFYLANPEASVMEVWNCELVPPYVPPTPDTTEYAASKVMELERVCYGSVSVSSLEYAMANACLAGTSLIYTGEKYYTVTEAKEVMKRFMDESYKAMRIYTEYKTKINNASTIDDIDLLYEEAVNKL